MSWMPRAARLARAQQRAATLCHHLGGGLQLAVHGNFKRKIAVPSRREMPRMPGSGRSCSSAVVRLTAAPLICHDHETAWDFAGLTACSSIEQLHQAQHFAARDVKQDLAVEDWNVRDLGLCKQI